VRDYVECLFNEVNIKGRVATRFKVPAESHLAKIELASI
jgi:hypothetical protein